MPWLGHLHALARASGPSLIFSSLVSNGIWVNQAADSHSRPSRWLARPPGQTVRQLRGISPTDPEREQHLAVDGTVCAHDVVNEGAQVLTDAITVTGVAGHGIRNLAGQQLGGTVGTWKRHNL